MSVAIDLDMMPLIGEPLTVELANTAYLRPGSPIDFLSTSEGISRWFHIAAPDCPSPIPRHLSVDRCDSVRIIRDATRDVLHAATQRDPIPNGALTKLNRFLESSPCRVLIGYSDGQPTIQTLPTRRGFDGALAYLAIECATFIASPQLSSVRRCDGPDCPMFFAQHHHKRRFCHEDCAHRARQNRYYRNHRHKETRT